MSEGALYCKITPEGQTEEPLRFLFFRFYCDKEMERENTVNVNNIKPISV